LQIFTLAPFESRAAECASCQFHWYLLNLTFSLFAIHQQNRTLVWQLGCRSKH